MDQAAGRRWPLEGRRVWSGPQLPNPTGVQDAQMPNSAKAFGLHHTQQGRTRTFWCAFLLRLGYDRVVV